MPETWLKMPNNGKRSEKGAKKKEDPCPEAGVF
jgi:hypothetical protein